jgi:hypothetical protein
MVPGTTSSTDNWPHLATDDDLRVLHVERATYRVPITTLQLPKDQGGCALPGLALKCRALFLVRLWATATQKRSITAAFLRTWKLTDKVENPPNVGGIPTALEYIRQYALDMAYVTRTHADEALRKTRQQICQVLRNIYSANGRNAEMRILRKHPETKWKRLWQNIHTPWISDAQKSTWSMLIHHLTPTNESMFAINLTNTNRCATCGSTDTMQHRLRQCGES